jgi:hypothetical protein
VQQDSGEQQPHPTAQMLERAVGRYRELLVAANPDAVPELIQGPGIEELDASLAGAKAAFARAREAARAELSASPGITNPVRRDLPPAGLDGAGPFAKIAWGLARAQE